MPKLEPSLQLNLSSWRTELGYARTGKHPSNISPDEVENRRITVLVTFQGDIAALRAAGLETGFDSGGKVSGLIALRDINKLEAVPGVTRIAMQPRTKLMLDTSVRDMRVPWRVPPTTPWPGRGAGVIVAVVDTGIDIFHESFRKANGTTRILELWDQSATTGGSAPPTAFAQVGRVYSENDINNALTAGPPFASTDNNGHGTHVAGIAAGNGSQDDRCSNPGRYIGVAPEADLVIVKATVNDFDAFYWCAQAKTRLPGNKPVVINYSSGGDTGPHDGTGALDGVVDDILRPAGGPPAGIAFVSAAGNEHNKDIHETGTVAANGSATISFYIGDGSMRMDTLDIWYNGTASLTIELIAPPNPSAAGGNSSGAIAPGANGNFPIGQMTLHVTSSAAAMSHHNNKKEIEVEISTPSGVSVRPGVWQMRLTESAGVAATWHAWFATQHGDTYPTFRLPSESDPVPRRRENTISEPGTSRNAITVASYDDDGGELAESSSHGPPNQVPPLPVGEVKPTIAAPGRKITAPRSRNDPQSRSSCCDQKVIDKSGTSMATPHVAGLVALMFEKNRNLTFEQVRAHLQHSASIDGIPTAEVPPVYDAALGIRANALWGSGKVSAAAALAEMPAAQPIMAGGGGGGGGVSFRFEAAELGFTPHTMVSRLGEWRNRFGPRPGLMLLASLVSEHVDEILRLINRNPRVGAVWRSNGGPLLVRRLLHGPPPSEMLLPIAIEGCDVPQLLARFIPVLDRFGGARLKSDISLFRNFAEQWPGANLQQLDEEASKYGGGA